MGLNLFKRGLYFLATTGFILAGCNSSNKYNDLPKPEKLKSKLEIVRVEAKDPVKQAHYISVPQLDKGIEKNNFYFSQNILVDKNISLDYKRFLLPKQIYALKNNQKDDASQTRNEIYGYFGLSGLSGLRIIPNKIKVYNNSYIDAGFHFKLLKLEDILRFSSEERSFGFLKSAKFKLEFKF